jgi:hypothetical protein
MGNIEYKPVQPGLGGKIIKEEKIMQGVIKQFEPVMVPTRKGGICRAKLDQNTQVEEVKRKKIGNLPGWKIATTTKIDRFLYGEWMPGTISEGSIIGAHREQVKKLRSEKEIKTEPQSLGASLPTKS